MNVQELDDTELNSVVKITDMENVFDITEDESGHYLYNMNVGVYIDVPDSAIQYKTIDHDLFWPTISYQIYGTTRLAWLLMKLNDVKAEDVFKKKHASDKIKYISSEDMQSIITSMNDFNT